MLTTLLFALACISATSAQNVSSSTEGPVTSSTGPAPGINKKSNRTVHYGVHIDRHGCIYKVLKSGNALYTVSCHAWCPDGFFYQLPNFTPCLQIANDFAERSIRAHVTQCIRGICVRGECRHYARRVNCNVPKARKHCWDEYGNYYLMRR
ncbi:uncharacterized protein LOC142590275 isoform X2 [Dermacentor variabilis]|uniref:uncharacterized protein LOC142590275 isoform X2 n=1 Tax=Dermacentor variabilis TaxID=34621 RepID=UPI003F5B57AB